MVILRPFALFLPKVRGINLEKEQKFILLDNSLCDLFADVKAYR